MKPCPVRLNCPDATDSPFTNNSSEAPDVDLEWTFNNGNSGLWPPIGSTWDWPAVPIWCANDPFICEGPQLPNAAGGNPGEGTSGWRGPGGNRIPIFFNTPQNCVAQCPNGGSFDYTVPAGSYTALSQKLADDMAMSTACSRAQQGLVCMGNLRTACCLNQPYSSETSSTGGTAPYTYDLSSGMFPPGLFPHSTPEGNFLLSGTPNTGGDFSFVIKVTDAAGHSSNNPFTIHVLEITNAKLLPNAVEGRAYSQALHSQGGTAPFTYQVVSGSLGNGITVSTFGTISGTPDYVTSGTYTAQVKVTDADNNSCTQDVTLITVPAPGPNWDAFVWTFSDSVNGSGAGAGRTATATCTSDGNPPFAHVQNIFASGVNYTGPAVNARIKISITYNGVVPAGNTFAAFLSKAATPITSYAQTFSTGVYTFDFSTGVGAGEAWTINDGFPGNSFCQCFFIGNVATASIVFQIFNL